MSKYRRNWTVGDIARHSSTLASSVAFWQYLGKLDWVLEHLHLTPIVSLSYFVPDTKKSGGQHITVPFQVKRFDEEKQELVSVEKERVKIEEIVGVEILK